jgi:hypothetical protein
MSAAHQEPPARRKANSRRCATRSAPDAARRNSAKAETEPGDSPKAGVSAASGRKKKLRSDGRAPKAAKRNRRTRLARSSGTGTAASRKRTESEDATIARLAALPLREYDKLRKATAKQLGFSRISVFEGLVEQARREQRMREARENREAREKAAAAAAAAGNTDNGAAKGDARPTTMDEGVTEESAGGDATPSGASGFTIIDPPESEGAPPTKDESRPGGKNNGAQREEIVAAVDSAGVVFWHDPDGNAYATVPSKTSLRRYRVQSRAFRLVVRLIYGSANPTSGRHGTVRPRSVSETAMAEAIPAFEAMALFGACMQPSVRVCDVSGVIILDLGDRSWRAVRIDPDGWRVIDSTRAPLIRPDGMRALAEPVRDPDALNKLQNLLNLAGGTDGDDQFRLILMWCLGCLWPSGPYPVLAFDGEHGSAKSTTSRMIRRLVDPNASDLRAPPRSEDDLLIAALNSRVVAWDNVSFMDAAMADAVCRLATGSGLGKRKLYYDLDEVLVSVSRPVLLNGIPSLLSRPDLADRAIAIALPPMPDEARRPESEIWAEFESIAPSVLGLLLDGLVIALRRLPTLRLESLPRMADFARLSVAAAPAFGWTEEDVLAALTQNRAAIVDVVIEADAVALALRKLCMEAREWQGTATELLQRINTLVPLDTVKERGWPKDGARLSTRLKRVIPALRRAGVVVLQEREGGTGERLITIKPGPSHTTSGGRHERHAASQRPKTNAEGAEATAPNRDGSGGSPEKSPDVTLGDADDAAAVNPRGPSGTRGNGASKPDIWEGWV